MTSEKQITEDLLKIIDQEIDRIADEIFAESQRNLVDDEKIDTGNLLKTANVNREFLHKTIIYPAPYADVVEFGRQPGSMPPVSAIAQWAQRHGISDPEKTAWAIANAIKARGIKPTFYLTDAVITVAGVPPHT